MPLYDMHCTGENCKYRGEQLYQTMEELAGARCPECNSKLEKNAAQLFSIGGKNGKSGLKLMRIDIDAYLCKLPSGQSALGVIPKIREATPDEAAEVEAQIERKNALPSVN